MSLSRAARISLVAFSIVGLRCDRSKPGPSTSSSSAPLAIQSAPSSPGSGAPTPSSGPSSTHGADAGPAGWYACTKNEDCAVVNSGRCCPPCDPLVFTGNYTAINVKFKADHIKHEGCATAACPVCGTPYPFTPRPDSNFFALCQEGRCNAIDLRSSKYVKCRTSKDCALRFGTGCCEGCNDKDLVTFNPASSLVADLCTSKPTCPPVSAKCRAERSPTKAAECSVDQCQLTDNN